MSQALGETPVEHSVGPNVREAHCDGWTGQRGVDDRVMNIESNLRHPVASQDGVEQ